MIPGVSKKRTPLNLKYQYIWLSSKNHSQSNYVWHLVEVPYENFVRISLILHNLPYSASDTSNISCTKTDVRYSLINKSLSIISALKLTLKLYFVKALYQMQN